MDEISPKKSGGRYKDLITFVEDRKGHDFRYAISNKKVDSDLGFAPSGDFEKHIIETIEFYLGK